MTHTITIGAITVEVHEALNGGFDLFAMKGGSDLWNSYHANLSGLLAEVADIAERGERAGMVADYGTYDD